ncbi:HD domain-containing protein [Patescibacteria group bacterium]|nr:HD domain-containing protein [Patescibacteria group bacterium]
MIEKPPNVYERKFDTPKANIPQNELPPLVEAREEMEVYQGVSAEKYAERLEFEASPEAREVFENVLKICRAIKDIGGTALLVGGTVRDEIRGSLSRDFDVEVYGLEAEQVEEIVSKFGIVNEVGKAFGILKITDQSGIDIDVSLPRTDSKTGEGHKGFAVKTDPNMSVKEAARRRDFTFNTLAKDPLSGEIYDAFGGVEDLRTRTLRVTDKELFQDDPLRVMRGAQFVARMGLRIEPETMALMQSMVDDLETLPPDRMKEEWEKLLLKPDRPSMGLQTLFNIGVIHKLYPELAALETTPQEFEWHPEGDVWIHTLMVTDSARDVVRSHDLDSATARTVMWAALCHDLGKPITTQHQEKGETMRYTARAHDIQGEEPTRAFLAKLNLPKKVVEKVVNIVKDHLTPNVMYLSHLRKGEKITDGAFRRLAKRLEPATIAECTYVAEADSLGRGPFLDPEHADQFLLPVVTEPYDGFAGGAWAREKAESLHVLEKKAQTIIRGRDLINIGFTPGIQFGVLIKVADECRDSLDMGQEQILEIILDNRDSIENAIASLQSQLNKSNS